MSSLCLLRGGRFHEDRVELRPGGRNGDVRTALLVANGCFFVGYKTLQKHNEAFT
jgi:hypothetical protein